MPPTNMPGPTLPSRSGTIPANLARIALLIGIWLPFFGFVIFLLPQFMPLFDKLAEKKELPTLTLYLCEFGRLNAVTFGAPTLICYVVLVFADITIARTASHSKLGVCLYRAWLGVLGSV